MILGKKSNVIPISARKRGRGPYRRSKLLPHSKVAGIGHWIRANSYRIVLALSGVCIIGLLAYEISQKPWPITVTLGHIAASSNCNAARAMQLAPARMGQPGYYPKHDADHDGIACEPYP
jgi:hypothetical protein